MKTLNDEEVSELVDLFFFTSKASAIEIEDRVNKEPIDWKRDLLIKISFIIWGKP